MVQRAIEGVQLTGDMKPGYSEILSAEALAFVAELHRVFAPRRAELLAARMQRYEALRAGAELDFLAETKHIREDSAWRVAPTPDDLQNRRVEITGPVEAKMMINALNSGANVFMADIEDANSPTWDNVVQGQVNLKHAVLGTLSFQNPDGKSYQLNEETATLLVRPRGWHLPEKHMLVDGAPVSASLFDFGLYFFHNAKTRIANGSGPYFYLPKLESHLEARLWNDVFNHAQDALGIARGSVRVTVLIETITAAFEMEEILYELRDHMAGLNAGRWDYIFSLIKKFRHSNTHLLPDRGQVTMAVPFMSAYAEALVSACHRRGAHAIGGMAAFIPNRRDPEVTQRALAKVREDKETEANAGSDGTWVAHPDLVPIAREIFDKVLGDQPHQKHRLREDVQITAKDLTDVTIEGGQITIDGVRLNVNIAIQYIAHWLHGRGAVAINNLMEDAATAEISRAQLWQWRHNRATLTNGEVLDDALYRRVRAEELTSLQALDADYFNTAAEVLDALVLCEEFEDFLTLQAYPYLD